MPKESMTCISDDTRKKLDEFIEKNYHKLLAYARYQEHNHELATAMLHDTILKLYDGRRVLDFSGYPLKHFEFLLKNTISHARQNRQNAFEEGYTVKVGMNGSVRRVYVRHPSDEILKSKIADSLFDFIQIENNELYSLYLQYKSTLLPVHQYLLTYLENGHSVNMMHTALRDMQINHTKQWIRNNIRRLVHQIEQKIGLAHFQVG
jgi:hypothetical protein